MSTRILLLVACIAAMLVPGTTASTASGAAVALVAFGLAVKWARSRTRSRTLRGLEASAGLFAAAIVVRGIESAVAGDVVYPGWADVLVVPAYLMVTGSFVAIAVTKHTTATKSADVLDAAAFALTAVTVAFAASAPYLFSPTISPANQALSMTYLLLEVMFLTGIVAVSFADTQHTAAARWLLASALLITAIDIADYVLAAHGWNLPFDPVRRSYPVPAVAFAFAAGSADYPELAAQGHRRQQHRWLLYPMCLVVLGVITLVPGAAYADLGVYGLGVVLAARVAVDHVAVGRISTLSTAHHDLAAALADADTVPTALTAAHDACRRVVDDGALIQLITSTAGSATNVSERAFDSDRPQILIDSADRSIRARIAPPPRPHQWAAVHQIIDLTSFAIDAIESRNQRITERATANWRALSGEHNELAFIVNPDATIAVATPNAVTILGFDPVGHPVSDIANLDPEILESPGEHVSNVGDRWMAANVQRSDRGWILTVTDATARVVAATVDPITNLANLTQFRELPTLEHATLILFEIVDYDRHSALLGADAADQLLAKVAAKARTVFREGIDELWRGPGATILARCAGAQYTTSWVDRRRSDLGGDYETAAGPVRVDVRAGIVAIESPREPGEALQQAQATLQQATGVVARFDPAIEAAARRRYEIEDILTRVTDPAAAGFVVHYQPIVDASTGVPRRLEALLRWDHADLGLVSPAEFIPAAERCNRIELLDHYVRQRAAVDLVEFRAQQPELKVQVNVSPAGLTPDALCGLAEWVAALPDPTGIVFELIESAVADFDALLPALEALAETGAGVSCDDYGVGESNMARLASGPWTQVKLAGIFADASMNRNVIARTIATIHSLDAEVVVENIETADQADAMSSAGADLLQGWLYAAAMSPEDIRIYLHATSTNAE